MVRFPKKQDNTKKETTHNTNNTNLVSSEMRNPEQNSENSELEKQYQNQKKIRNEAKKFYQKMTNEIPEKVFVHFQVVVDILLELERERERKKRERKRKEKVSHNSFTTSTFRPETKQFLKKYSSKSLDLLL
jgi:hypothetical protein